MKQQQRGPHPGPQPTQTINPDQERIQKYIHYNIIRRKGIICPVTIPGEYLSGVKEILKDREIYDIQTIHNMAWICHIMKGLNEWGEKADEEEEARQCFANDLYQFGKFMDEYDLTGISFKGKHKQEGARRPGTITIMGGMFIKRLKNLIDTDLLELYRMWNDHGFFEAERKGKGRPKKMSMIQRRIFKRGLEKYIVKDLFLSNMNPREKAVFIGQLFALAGILMTRNEFDEYRDKKDKVRGKGCNYSSYRDYIRKNVDNL